MFKFIRTILSRPAAGGRVPPAITTVHDGAYEVLARYSAAQEFVRVWERSKIGADISMNCTEAEVLADLFRVFGREEHADEVVHAHGEEDDGCGDLHHLCEDCLTQAA